MMKKKGIVFGTSLIILGMISSGLAASVAWFIAEENTLRANVSGSVVEEYFHCGTGTQADPFVITRPMHYYHLVEFFQRKTVLGANARFGTDFLYFRVGADLDNNPANGLEVFTYENDGTTDESYGKILNMSYFSGDNALMPIGTSECPFFGSFDGGASATAANCIIIENLNIKSVEDVVLHGQSSTTTRYTSDVGMFGYVSDNDGSGNDTVIENLYVDGLTIDTTGAVANKNPASGVSHTSAHTDEVNVGYIVGHLHAYTNKTTSNDATPLHDVYVNNAKILGGAAGAKNNFGYIGYVDTIDTHPSSDYALDKQIKALQDASGGGTGDDWGGSIPFNSFNNRLYNSLKTTSTMGITTKNTSGNTITSGGPMYRYYSKTDSKVTVYRGGSSAYTYFNSNPATSPIVYNLMGEKATYGSTNPGTVLPLQINDDYTVNSKNTGYITSDSVDNNNGTVRSASYKIQHIVGSLGDYSTSTYTIANLYNKTYGLSYDSSKFEVLTNKGTKSSDGYALVSDDYNSSHTPTSGTFLYSYRSNKQTYEDLGLVRYKDARDDLDEILSGASVAHGIHFYGSTSDTSTRVTYSSPYTITAKINGSDAIANYPLPRSCIDFNLKERGHITLFAGSYYPAGSNTEADSILSLFKVTRNNSNTITNIQQIQKIFNNPNYDSTDPTSEKYLYSFNGSTPTGASASDQIFDVKGYLDTVPQRNVVCYFEIPVNAGEYAIGGVTGKAAGAYLMYLDIGTSGSDEQQTEDQKNKIAEEPIFTQIEYLEDMSNGYVTNACFNIGFTVPSGATKNNFWVIVDRDDDVFNVTIVNTSGNDFVLYVLLVDDDDDADNTYPYTYTLKYNTGAVSEQYGYSGAWEGTTGGTILSPHTIVLS